MENLEKNELGRTYGLPRGWERIKNFAAFVGLKRGLW